MGLLNLLGMKSHPEVIDIDELIKSGGADQYRLMGGAATQKDYEDYLAKQREDGVECSGITMRDNYSHICVSG